MSSLKPINCLIIDDEVSAQEVLEHYITQTSFLKLSGICKSTKEAFKALQVEDDIKVLFLDINMPRESGIDFYKSLQHPPQVIFTTAYPEFAVEGFEVNALDYLLKPFSYERFLIAAKKLKSVNVNNDKPPYLIIKENKTLHKVNFSHILFIEALGDYVKVHTKSETITTHSTFTNFLKQLPASFLRTHKSFCINSQYMKRISGNLIYIEDLSIPIGATYKSSVLKALHL